MFVTYVVLDPRKPGRFESPNCSFLFQPVYIGKGNTNRSGNISYILSNADDYKPHSGKMFDCWCKKMIKCNITDVPVIEFAATDEQEAFDTEERLTKHFGLKIEGGILYNSRHGGNGGWSVSSETKKILSIINAGEGNPNYGTSWSEERRTKWYNTINEKKKTGKNKRSDKSMMPAWEKRRRTYEITTVLGQKILVEDLTDWCKNNGYPLSALRKALKSNGVVKSTSKRLSKVEGWLIRYLDSLDSAIDVK